MTGYFMGVHIELRMWKFPQYTISSAKLFIIPTNSKFDEAVRYIHDNKSWERCYLLLNVIFPCLKVLLLEYSNHSGVEFFIIIWEWPSSALIKYHLVLVLRKYSQTYHHQPIYWTCLKMKVMKKIHYQMNTLSIQKIYVFFVSKLWIEI